MPYDINLNATIIPSIFYFYFIIIRQNSYQKLMRNYSFSNIAAQQSFDTRKSSEYSNVYRGGERVIDTSHRFQEIKKKYDTPIRRDRIESLKKSKDMDLMRHDGKENPYLQRAPTFGSNLKQSIALNRMEKVGLSNQYDSQQLINSKIAQHRYRRGSENEQDYLKKGQKDQSYSYINRPREMKESVLQSDYSKGSSTGKSFYGPYVDKNQAKKEYEPRVKNIQNINSKIKDLLSTFNENEKNTSSYGKYQQKKDIEPKKQESFSTNKQSAFFGNRLRQISESSKTYDSHMHKNSDVEEKYNFLQTKPTGEIQPSRINYYQKYEAKNTKVTKEEHSGFRDYTPVSYKDISLRQKREEDLSKTPKYLSKQPIIIKGQRSKSFIDPGKKSSIGNNLDSSFTSGKKFDDEINKYQKKIEQLEREKKKANISFTPFSAKSNKSSSNLNLIARNRQSYDIPSQKETISPSTIQSRPSISSTIQNQTKFKSYLSKARTFQDNYDEAQPKLQQVSKNINTSDHTRNNDPQPQFQQRLEHIQVKTVRIQNSIENNEEESINSYNFANFDSNIIKRCNQGMQERRRMRQQDGKSKFDADNTGSGEMKKLVGLFCEQVKLDQNFRNLKLWFESTQDPSKNTKISSALSKVGISISIHQIHKTFSVDQSQNNPFFSVQNFDGSYDSLSRAYFSSQQHWQTQIQHKFNRQNLQNCGFSTQRLDLQRKGYIQLQDLVRFLNIQSGTFFRNRDLFLIFRRLSGQQRVDFASILRELC